MIQKPCHSGLSTVRCSGRPRSSGRVTDEVLQSYSLHSPIKQLKWHGLMAEEERSSFSRAATAHMAINMCAPLLEAMSCGGCTMSSGSYFTSVRKQFLSREMTTDHWLRGNRTDFAEDFYLLFLSFLQQGICQSSHFHACLSTQMCIINEIIQTHTQRLRVIDRCTM